MSRRNVRNEIEVLNCVTSKPVLLFFKIIMVDINRYAHKANSLGTNTGSIRLEA
jgi:hypothetical protein